ncbi:MAG: protein-methionine-sulfoxide reductase catalytic subunit MsrP [Thermodesulfobacteriota bacterium]
MHVKIKKPWDTERRATEEEVYLGRRSFLKKAAKYSIAAGVALYGVDSLAALPSTLATHPLSPFQRPLNTGSYPAPRNSLFTLDRPLTHEAVAARYNNFYEFSAKKNVYKYVDGFVVRPWTIKISGLVKRPGVYDVEKLIKKFGLEERLYRFRCVEAWAMAVPWTGFPLKKLLEMVEPESGARYVILRTLHDKEVFRQQKIRFWLPWPYTEGLTIEEAGNELTLLATGIYGHKLPGQHGAPIRLVTPWKYGFKSIKSIVSIEFAAKKPATFWNTLEPSEYGFTSNVDPEVPHPRWSQATERMLGTEERRKTLKYNGYGEFVAGLYR